MAKVLITSQPFRRLAGDHERRLVDAECELIASPYARSATEDELIRLVGDVDAVIAGSDDFTRQVLAAAPRVRIVARVGVGYDAVDVEAADELGIWVTTTPGTNEQSVADATMGMLLMLARKFVPAAESTRAGRWVRPFGLELRGLTLGLIGFGRIGRQVAQRARAFGLEVVIHDVVQDESVARELECRYVPLEELLRTADFVSLHAPATPQTRDVINRETLASMKPTAYLINTARGELVDEDALADALAAERIAGAALDVFKKEPPTPDNRLLKLPNVIALPHIAGVTAQASEKMAALAVDNVLAVLRGERPPHPVNSPSKPRVYT